MGKKGYQLHEEAWNAYPYCKTVITNPGYMKDDMKVIIETLHLPDNGSTENVLQMPKADYDKIQMQVLDVIKDTNGIKDKECSPRTFKYAYYIS